MKNAFGENFTVTDKLVPEDFFKTMFETMTHSIEDSRLSIESEIRSMLSEASSIKEIIDEEGVSVLEVDAEYTVPQFPKLEPSKLAQ